MITKSNFTALYIESSFDFSFSLFFFYLEGERSSAFQYICIYANAIWGCFILAPFYRKKNNWHERCKESI